MKRLLFLLLTAMNAFAAIHTAPTLSPIERELASAGPETLVLLDICGTLIDHKDVLFHRQYDRWLVGWYQRHFSKLKPEELLQLVRVVEMDWKNWRLLDPAWPKLIEGAQERGAKVAALSLLKLQTMTKEERIARLKAFKIPLCDALHPLSDGETYEYAYGVIGVDENYAKPVTKGPVVEEVLSKLPFQPSKIVFVDDRIEQVQSVHAACERAGIPCTAFHITAFDFDLPPFDREVADLQMTTLLKEKRWLSAYEARARLDSYGS